MKLILTHQSVAEIKQQGKNRIADKTKKKNTSKGLQFPIYGAF